MKNMDYEELLGYLTEYLGDESEAKDYSAANFLKDGDTGPLLDLLENDQPIPFRVRKVLIAMLKDGSRNDMKTAVRFKVVRRDGVLGAPKGRLGKRGRDVKIGIEVLEYMKKHGEGTYDAAIAETANELRITKSAAREAYSFVKTFLY